MKLIILTIALIAAMFGIVICCIVILAALASSYDDYEAMDEHRYSRIEDL
jgi:hypothetical protein